MTLNSKRKPYIVSVFIIISLLIASCFNPNKMPINKQCDAMVAKYLPQFSTYLTEVNCTNFEDRNPTEVLIEDCHIIKKFRKLIDTSHLDIFKFQNDGGVRLKLELNTGEIVCLTQTNLIIIDGKVYESSSEILELLRQMKLITTIQHPKEIEIK